MDDSAEIRGFFIEEALELLKRCQRVLASLATGHTTDGTIEDIRRSFHNIKGAAFSVPGFQFVGEVAGLAERLAGALERGVLAMNAGVLDVLRETCEALLNNLAEPPGEAGADQFPAHTLARLQYCCERVLELESDAPALTPVSLDSELKSFK